MVKKCPFLFSLAGDMCHEPPLVKTNMELHIPNAVVVPSVDEIQICFNHIMQTTLEIMKSVTIWAQRDLSKLLDEGPLNEDISTLYIFKYKF